MGCGLLLQAAPVCAQATPPAATLVTCPPLRLALLSYPGYYQRAADGTASGMDVDIADELTTRSGCSFSKSGTNVARLWPGMMAGLSDLSTGTAFLPERQQDVDYLWLVRGRSMVMMPKAQAEKTPTREAFEADPKLKLGVLRGAHRGTQAKAWVEMLRAQGRISESADMPSLVRAYEAGRVAAVLMLPGAMQRRDPGWLAQHPLLDWLPQDRITAGWTVSRRNVDAATRRRLLAAADSMRSDGTLLRMLRRNLGDAVARQYEILPGTADSSVPATSAASAP
jgi:polar amino acid transport system substrate-binding protein